MSTKKYLDNNGVLYFWGKIKTYITSVLANKGDNLTYTDNKLSLKSGATTLSQVTIAGGSGGTTDYTLLSNKPKINNVELTGNKTLADLGINIPTKTSALTNDSNFQTGSQVSSAISSAIAGVTQFNHQVVTELPASGVKGTIYLLGATNAQGQNVYQEYIWVDNKFERLGVEVDLTPYVKSVDLVTITNGEIDTIIAS